MKLTQRALLLIVFSCFSFIVAYKCHAASNKIVLVHINYLSPERLVYYEHIYEEAFKRVDKNIVLEIRPVNAKRASLLANSGDVDGETGRVYNYNNKYTNLVRVEESILPIEFYAFAVNPNVQVNKWGDLAGNNLKVEYIRGIKVTDVQLAKIVEKGRLSVVNDAIRGFRNLRAGKTDVFVITKPTANQALGTAEFKEANIRWLGMLERQTLHLYLHKRHAELAKKVSKAMSDMRQEGIFSKMRKDILGEKYL